MKDVYGTEYVRPAACSHFGRPLWRCLPAHPEPIPPPAPAAEERLAERERVRDYRELAANYRGYAARATSPEVRDELNRKASDYEHMANGRWEETSAVKASAKSRDEVQQAGSERLFASAFVGVIRGLAFLYATWGEFGKRYLSPSSPPSSSSVSARGRSISSSTSSSACPRRPNPRQGAVPSPGNARSARGSCRCVAGSVSENRTGFVNRSRPGHREPGGVDGEQAR